MKLHWAIHKPKYGNYESDIRTEQHILSSSDLYKQNVDSFESGLFFPSVEGLSIRGLLVAALSAPGEAQIWGQR